MSLLLAADIGNSHTVLGLVEDGKVTRDWRVATSEHRTADEWAVLLRGLLGDDVEHVTGIAVCATVPAVLQEWRLMLADHFADVRSVVVEPGVRTGVPVLMDNPREVGSDRIINALAAATEYGGPAIVVDFGGTATTFDVVSAKGQYIGGSIAPGSRYPSRRWGSAVPSCARSNWSGRVRSLPKTPSKRCSRACFSGSPASSRELWAG